MHFSFGNLSTGPNWKLQSNYVGEIFNFTSIAGSGCQHCAVQMDADLMKAGIMSLTVKLQQYLAAPASLLPFSLKTLGREDVIPFLTKHLQWLIIDVSHCFRNSVHGEHKLIHPVRRQYKATNRGFKVMVLTRVFQPPASEDVLGPWHAYEPTVEITHNKVGGLNQGESFDRLRTQMADAMELAFCGG